MSYCSKALNTTLSKKGILVLFWTWAEMLSVFLLLNIMLAIGLSYMLLIILMYGSSGSNFSRAFIMKIHLFLSSAFSVSIKMIIWFSYLSLFIMMYYTYCFVYIETTMYLWDKAHWSWHTILIYSQIWCVSIFLITFVSIFNKKSLVFWFVIFFFVCSLWFWHQEVLAS